MDLSSRESRQKYSLTYLNLDVYCSIQGKDSYIGELHLVLDHRSLNQLISVLQTMDQEICYNSTIKYNTVKE